VWVGSDPKTEEKTFLKKSESTIRPVPKKDIRMKANFLRVNVS
jgi:hypothetical protein